MAQYSDEISAAGFTDEQVAMAVEAVKNGTLLPDDIMAAMKQYGISIPTIADYAGNTAHSTSGSDGADTPKAQSNK